MPKFSQKSTAALATCHPDIQQIFNGIILVRDCSILHGHRGQEEQDELFRLGRSEKKFPDSKHNSSPSLAIDVIPYPLQPSDWLNRTFWIEWSSWVKGFAASRGVTLISGYDWDHDNNYDVSEQNFWDGPHFQLKLKA